MSPGRYDEDMPLHAGLGREDHRRAARQDHPGGARVRPNAEKTNGRSMVIIGAAMNHWYHADMNYRGVINMLAMCGCVGQSGGWMAHMSAREAQAATGWAPPPSVSTGRRPPRQQNSTSAFYAHTDQWRYETIDVGEISFRRRRRWPVGRRDHRLQRARRAHGLAAVRRILETEPARIIAAKRQGRRARAGGITSRRS